LGILYSIHDNPMAIEYLNTALQIEPSNTNTLYALALFYQNRNDYEDAESLAWKCKFIKETGMRGAMYWEYRCDDEVGTLRHAVWDGVMGQ
jgi:tetratricopeptide (TPR) repeat protein